MRFFVATFRLTILDYRDIIKLYCHTNQWQFVHSVGCADITQKTPKTANLRRIAMQLSLVPRQQHQFEVSGGITASVFPEVELMLMSSSELQNALKFVSNRKNMDRYHSVIDFLFCEIFQEYRRPCMRFYKGRGRQLRETATQEEIENFGKALVRAIEIAYARFSEKRAASWSALRTEVLRSVA